MGMFDRFLKTEERALENPNAPVSADDFLHIMGWGDFSSAAGVTVNVDNALGVPAVWSAELNTDSVLNMESFLGRLLGERMARIANSKLTTGSGSSDVEGIVTNSAAGVTAASATAVTADEIIDLVHSVDPAYRVGNAAFMMNDSTLAAVRKLKDGDGNYLWQMSNYQAGVPQNRLGYNVVVNQDMDSIATAKKTILFGDMSYYYVRKVGQPAIYVARERFAPDFGILGYIRFDGVLSNTAAIKHLVQA